MQTGAPARFDYSAAGQIKLKLGLKNGQILISSVMLKLVYVFGF